MLTEKHSVVLRANLPARELEFLSHWCNKLVSNTGEELLYMLCTKIDTTHHVYISLDTFKHGDEFPHSVQIPHQFVLFISGSDYPKGIGFTSPVENAG
jgi:hypothetical protein